MRAARKVFAALFLTVVCIAQDPDITFNQLGPGLLHLTNGLDTTLDVNTTAIASVGQNTFGGMQDMSLARFRMPVTLGIPPSNECTAATLGEVRLQVQLVLLLYFCTEITPGTTAWKLFQPASAQHASAVAS